MKALRYSIRIQLRKAGCSAFSSASVTEFNIQLFRLDQGFRAVYRDTTFSPKFKSKIAAETLSLGATACFMFFELY